MNVDGPGQKAKMSQFLPIICFYPTEVCSEGQDHLVQPQYLERLSPAHCDVGSNTTPINI